MVHVQGLMSSAHFSRQRWAGIAQPVRRTAAGWTVQEPATGGGEISHICPDCSWAPSSLLYSGYRVSVSGVRRPGRDVHPHPFSAEGKERVEQYPFGPPWPVIVRTMNFTLPLQATHFSSILQPTPNPKYEVSRLKFSM